ncbi:succinate receptor 1-like [Salminus brasiliensis]|uniref:succinate receptor 1-like n=1 Tax=Salminus brasiliensis TaxID=930266 RepID=UPI003B833442
MQRSCWLQVSNCSDVIPSLWKYYLSPVYAVEFAIGITGNLVVVLGYLFCLPSWKSTNVYLFNLAVSDLVFLCTLPHLSYTYAHGQQQYVAALCVANRYILHVNLYSSILFMVWVSVDRLLVLRHPQRDRFLLTCRGSLCVSLLTWIWVNIEVMPLIIFVLEDLKRNGWSKCNDFASLSEVNRTLIYSLVLTVTGYILPLLGLFLSSFKMVSLLTVQEQVFGTSFQKPLKILRATAIMFLVLYTPIHVMRNVRIASQLSEMSSPCSRNYIEAVYIVTRPLAFAHSVINPVFYFLMTDRFKELIQDKLRQLARTVMSRT